MNTHPLTQQYIEEVSKQIKARELREEIKDELAGHLLELMESKVSQGADEQEAARWALAQMGDAGTVARELNKVHKPRIPWAMLGTLIPLLIVALITMHALGVVYTDKGVAEYATLFSNQAMFIAIGLLVMFGLSRINYRSIIRWTIPLYAGAVGLMLTALIWGPQINGMSGYLGIGPVIFDVLQLSPFLFLLLSTAYLHRQQDSWKDIIIHFAMFTCVPIMLYVMAPSLSMMIIYAVVHTALIFILRRKAKWLLPHIVMLTVTTAFIGIFNSYIQARLAGFLQRNENAGYIYRTIDEAIRSAGWGGGDIAQVVDRLPHIHSETVLTFIIHQFGWGFGIAVLVCIALFAVQLIKSARSVRESFGRSLISALTALFTVQFAWGIGMSVGLLPILSSSTLPFISYGGSGMLTHLAAVGLIYSVYRRKDMILLKPMQQPAHHAMPPEGRG